MSLTQTFVAHTFLVQTSPIQASSRRYAIVPVLAEAMGLRANLARRRHSAAYRKDSSESGWRGSRIRVLQLCLLPAQGSKVLGICWLRPPIPWVLPVVQRSYFSYVLETMRLEMSGK